MEGYGTVTKLAHEGYDSCAANEAGDQKGERGVIARFRKCRPAVARYWLMLLAGLLWTGIGFGLCVTACVWLSEMDWPRNGLGSLLGFGFGGVMYRYAFSPLARRNLERIASQPTEVCLFAFQAWKSYGLILGMTAVGMVLRHLAVQRLMLGVIYAAIGTGLLLGSAIYYEAALGPGENP